jgi:hypothetical protein
VTREMKPSALKRLKDTYKSQDLLLPSLERHVMRSMNGSGRPDDHSRYHMHPSDMAKKDWCGRHDYYRITDTPVEKVSKANPSFRMENVFAEGHAIHGKYQQWLWEMGVLWGDWECRACGHRYGALSPEVCQFCQSPRLTYREVPLRRKQILIEGHADAAVHAAWFRGLVEIKSIGVGTLRFEAPRLFNLYQDGQSFEDVWWKINRPFTSHLKQGQLYLWMSWPAYDQIIFIYESKAHQATKEFIVTYDKNLIAPLLETARDVTSAVGTGAPPSRPLWAESSEGKVCASCEYRGTCWSLDVTTQAEDPPESLVRVRRIPSAKRRRLLGRAT